MAELKPCPFCGGDANYVAVPNGLLARCCKCGARSEIVHNHIINHYKRTDCPKEIRFGKTYKAVSDLWNKRDCETPK